MKRNLLFLFLLACAIHLPAQEINVRKKGKTDDAARVTEVDKICQKALTDFNIPGMAVAIVKDGKVIHAKGYGVKDISTGAAVDENSLFAIASNSKAFTAAALAVLVDEGKIKWSDKVRDYLPWFMLYSPYVSEEFTIRDLLCHRSGLATFSGDLIWYGTTWSREEVVKRARYLKPVYGFREAYGYSNIMYLAAGLVVEKVSGQTWDAFIRERFFQPLGMRTATTSVREFTATTNLAMPHNEVNGKNKVIEYVNWDNIGPAGSINASVSELSRWIMLQLGKGSLDGKKYWSEARTYEMWENLTPKPVGKWQRDNMPSRHFNGYGLGWELMEYGGHKVVSHGGGYDGMISKTVLVPELNLGFVILTNNNNSLPSALGFSILDRFVSKPENKDWPAIFLQFKKEEELETAVKNAEDEVARAKDSKPSLALDAYVGIYSSPMYGDVEVLKDDRGELQIDFHPTALFKGTLSHWHYDTFRLNWSTQMMLPPGKVTFVLDAEGKVSEIKVLCENPDFDFSELVLMKK